MSNESVKTHGWDDMGTPVPLTDEEISAKAARDWKADRKSTKCIGFICSLCAHALGGEWPDTHIATFHSGECEICKQKRSLAAPSDWQLGRDGVRRKIGPEEWD